MKLRMEDFEAIERHRKARGLDPETGQPVIDSTPAKPSVKKKRQGSVFEQVRQAIRQHQLEQLEHLNEDLDQADDYEIEDDHPDPESKWEYGSQFSVRQLREMVAQKKQELQELQQEEAAKRAAREAGGAIGGQGARPGGAGDQGGAGGPPPAK